MVKFFLEDETEVIKNDNELLTALENYLSGDDNKQVLFSYLDGEFGKDGYGIRLEDGSEDDIDSYTISVVNNVNTSVLEHWINDNNMTLSEVIEQIKLDIKDSELEEQKFDTFDKKRNVNPVGGRKKRGRKTGKKSKKSGKKSRKASKKVGGKKSRKGSKKAGRKTRKVHRR